MEPNNFIAEVYRRMDLLLPKSKNQSVTIKYNDFINNIDAKSAVYQYKSLLPNDKNAKILDIGFGNGWFMAACIELGYTNIYGVDFNGKEKMLDICKNSNSIIEVFNINSNIGDFLSENNKQFDFIHLSHVIEHIPKHSLLYIVDAIYMSLSNNGVALLRTPNMEGPLTSSDFYITLGHEYGFSASNLQSLLSICGFENISYHDFSIYNPSVKQYIGNFLRGIFIAFIKFKYRLFGATGDNYYGQFGLELIVSAKRGNLPALFSKKYK
ncbi:MAG TPA: methyltransferase domain-containing protein [Flavobacteriales bacterium]|jgi:2-polyprenyl-3-methyl-5-hydroxy-6-metoxy-1,4-benzoquinol methylase|nr:methyltransferase domain-containing protein [Flavobacteriales bacterium]